MKKGLILPAVAFVTMGALFGCSNQTLEADSVASIDSNGASGTVLRVSTADAQAHQFALEQYDSYSAGVNYYPFPFLQCRVAYTLRQTAKENLPKSSERHLLYGMLSFKF